MEELYKNGRRARSGRHAGRPATRGGAHMGRVAMAIEKPEIEEREKRNDAVEYS